MIKENFMSEKIVLMDGHSILNRAFYGMPDLTNSEGVHTNAILGFLNIMLKILEEEKPKYLTVAFDVSHPTFRHEMYTEYKGTRKAMAGELKQQIPIMKDVLKAMGITIVEQPGYEADDIIGTIARKAEQQGYEVAIISGDRDLLQLATNQVKVRIPKTKRTGTEIEDYNSKDVFEKYQVTPTEFIDLKALMGDASDNIPGVPGIGEKTATKIIKEFHSIEEAYAHVDEITPTKAKNNLKEHFELAKMSKVLATIKTDCDLDYSIEDSTYEEMFNEESYKLFRKLEFKSLVNRFGKESISIDLSSEQSQTVCFIETFDKAEKVFEEIKNKKVAYVGLHVFHTTEFQGLCLAYEADKVYYFEPQGFLTQEYLIGRVHELVQTGIMLAVINLKEQLPILKLKDQNPVFDLAIGAYLINPLKDTYEYDDIARDYLKKTVPSYSDLFGKSNAFAVRRDKEKEFEAYVGYEASVAYEGYEKVKQALKEKDMLELFEEIEMPLVYVLYDMEARGIRVNKDALKAYGNKLAARIAELEKQIYASVEEEFNINSPKQLGVILFEKLRLPFAKKTKTGYSTSAEILEKLRCEHEVVGMILEYRQLTKLKSTYADGLATYIQADERIHGKFNQTITATGRISSTEPNLQNIPIRMELGRQIRKVFIPEDGYVFLDADYSQIELRVLAALSGDERLVNAYRENQDIHRITASEVFHTPFDEVTSLQRSNAKAVNFGIVYGISSFSLSQDLNITKKEADNYIHKYFETYPAVKPYLDQVVEDAKEKGYVTTLLKRRRPIPELTSSNFMQRAFGERVAMNSPIQGTAADIIKLAMIHVNRKLEELGLKSRLILQIHDELLIETHLSEVEQVRKLLKEEMEQAISLEVPMEVEVNQGNDWYEAK